MNIKNPKLISAALISIVVVGGLQALIYILNLNQLRIYLHVAFWIYIYLILKITLLYDLHYKNPEAWEQLEAKYPGAKLMQKIKALGKAFWERLAHLRRWSELKQWLNYLILPGFLYWPSVCLFYLHMGDLKTQQLIATLSGFALIFTYWHLKEIFTRKDEQIKTGAITALSLIKLYAAFLVFTSAIGITRHFCLGLEHYALGIFSLSYLLIHQALFQFRLLSLKAVGLTLLFSAIITLFALIVYIHWGLNYFTAGAFLMVWYNFFWNLLHHYAEKHLTWSGLMELLAVTIIASVMLLGATNFRSRISDTCGIS